VLPQGVRLGIPLITGKAVSITKDTSLASVVAVPELLNQMSTEQGIYANPSPMMLGALMFLVIFVPLVQLSRIAERRYRWTR
jgi:polar amino acid transport system permease protein